MARPLSIGSATARNLVVRVSPEDDAGIATIQKALGKTTSQSDAVRHAIRETAARLRPKRGKNAKTTRKGE